MKKYRWEVDVMSNPFTLTFGVLPEQFISRDEIREMIVSDFTSDGKSESNVYILTGVRGSGKTVMLNHLKDEFNSLDNWLVININPEMDVLENLAAKLYEQGSLKKYFLKPTFNFSFKGLGFSIEGDVPIKSVESLLEKMIRILETKGKRILITIDEISNSQNIRIFAHTFKNLINDNLPVYLLATGLNENVYSLQNEKTLTFIYRAKKIEIKSLNQYAIARSYENVLGLEKEIACKCASLTEGYASAYQVLGSILYRTNKKDIDEDILYEFDKILEDINYSKMWEDLSYNDKKFLFGFSSQKDNRAKSIIEKSQISKESYSKYRERLIKRGIIISNSYGYLSLTLPRLYNYIERMRLFDSFE